MSSATGPKYKKGLVALSADPVTNGHLDIVRRAKEQCRELVVLVANNERKAGTYLYTLEERVQMTERAVREAGIRYATVVGSSGLLVDVYLFHGCDHLFRGVRNAKDLEYEDEQAELNRLILPKVQIDYLDAARELHIVSSSMVKGFVLQRLDVDKFVPMFVKQSLEERLLGQYRIGVTGCISVGKSWVAAEMVRLANFEKFGGKHINVDQLLRDVYDEDSPGAQDVRDELAKAFGCGILSDDRLIVNRKKLAEVLFVRGADDKRRFVTELTMPHVARKYREALASASGLVVVEWAQTAEMGMGTWTSNNVVIVDSPDRAFLMEQRGIDAERQKAMEEIQWSAARKERALKKAVAAAKSGTVKVHQNLRREHAATALHDIDKLFREVLQLFPGLQPKK